MPRLYDISPLLAADTAVWPGDVPLSQAIQCQLSAGASVNLSSLTSTVHLGAHADAPSHFRDGAADISQVDLTPYLGPCHVVDARGHRSVTPAHCAAALDQGAQRLLFRTDTATDRRSFPQDFAFIQADTIELCATYDVVLLGIDTPSVDPFSSKDLPAHHALLRHGIRNLEGLWLQDVAAGPYELIALPLKLAGFDASPVRAVLRSV